MLSVVTIVSKDLSAIMQTCDSVDSQTVLVYEHIVVVAGMQEQDKVQLVGRFGRPGRLFVFDQDTSIYNAMNIGLKKATGLWVLFLNGGDVFEGRDSVDFIMRNVAEDRCVVFGTVQADRENLYVRPPGKIKDGKISCCGHQGFVAPLDVNLKSRVFYNEKNLISADQQWMSECVHLYGADFVDYTVARFALGGISNRPTLLSFSMHMKSKRWPSAIKVILKMFLYKLLGRGRYYYLMAIFNGYQIKKIHSPKLSD